jgi:hypothetical protein
VLIGSGTDVLGGAASCFKISLHLERLAGLAVPSIDAQTTVASASLDDNPGRVDHLWISFVRSAQLSEPAGG